ncbi:MAG: MFS transporter [Armatimonadota bacterium]
MPDKNERFFGISKTVIMLGFVSLLTDISSESIYPLIPLFLTGVLHTPVSAIGLIEGIAESVASVVRIFSGWFSDKIGNRKWLTIAGYTLSTLSKPLLSFSSTWHHVLGIRFMDRLGKGIRAAPRDALIADVTPPEKRGISFGFHSAMDTTGAVLGPLIAFWLLKSVGLSFRQIFMLAAIPGAIGVLLLIFFVKEKHKTAEERKASLPSMRIGSFDGHFRMFLLITAVFSIGNSSDAFLILKAKQNGISTANILLVIVLFNSIQALLATPAGAVSDRLGRKNVILLGFLVFALVYMGFGMTSSPVITVVLFAFYGVYSALTYGVQKAFASDLIAANLRGTGLGAYNMVTGIALLPASLIAGVLWDRVSPSAPFVYGAAMALVAAIMLAFSFRGDVIYSGK